MIALYVHPKNSSHLRSHLRATMALDHSQLGLENKFLENNQAKFFLRSTSLLYKICGLTNLGECKITYYTFYTSHLRWNSTMRRCFYQKKSCRPRTALIHNFEIQIALIQYSGRSKHARAFSETALKISIQNHLYGQPVASCGVFEWTLIELPFNIIKNLSCLFFIEWFYNDVQSSKAWNMYRWNMYRDISFIHEDNSIKVSLKILSLQA